MQAITTKYFGPGAVRGSRFRAKCDAGSCWVSYDYEKNSEDNHRAAAEALLAKLGWTGTEIVGGSLPDGSMVWVLEHPWSPRVILTED
jgi:hypothetical protein